MGIVVPTPTLPPVSMVRAMPPPNKSYIDESARVVASENLGILLAVPDPPIVPAPVELIVIVLFPVSADKVMFVPPMNSRSSSVPEAVIVSVPIKIRLNVSSWLMVSVIVLEMVVPDISIPEPAV